MIKCIALIVLLLLVISAISEKTKPSQHNKTKTKDKVK